MTTKFGFQVTVQTKTTSRMLWIFPEDIDTAAVVAKAKAALKQILIEELTKQAAQLNGLIDQLPDSVPTEVKTELKKLDPSAKATALVEKGDITAIQTALAKQADKQVNALKAQANAGLVYSWTREAGEEPIVLGAINDLMDFISNAIGITGADFDVKAKFNDLLGGLPDPIGSTAQEIAEKAIFELDGLRLKIPGKGSGEKTQFEIAMLVDLNQLGLELGPLTLNRLYAKMGNFGSTSAETTAPE